MFRRIALALSWLTLAATLPATEAAEPPPVECLRVGEGAEVGRLLTVQAGKLTLARNGVEKTFPLDEFREIVFETGPIPTFPPPFTMWAADGRPLMVRQISEGARPVTLNLSGYGWAAESVAIASLRGIATRQFQAAASAEARAEQEAALADPPVGHDRVMLARDVHRYGVTCTVERITAGGLEILVGENRKAVEWAQVDWLVLSPSGWRPATPAGHLLELRYGSRIRLDSLELTGETLSGRADGARYTVEPGRVRWIRLCSDRYRYLSDLRPADVKLTPLLDVVWPPQWDAAVNGRPLTLGGRSYSKGIGMHTRTEMTFDLGGGYSRFLATIGVDDSAGARGRVVFRALADGETVSESKALSGEDGAAALEVDIGAAQRLTLVADFGALPSLEGNFADWADARVVR